MKRSAVFLDRDGTVIEDTGYLADPDQVRLIPGSSGAIRRLRDTGSLILIVSNQSGVARGLFDEADLARVHERMETLLHADGAQLDDAYYCPYLDGPDAAVAAYRRHSDLRKPHPGMLLAAARDHDLDLTASWMIGDAPSDVEAGARAGCRTILIDPDGTYEHNGRGTKPTHVVRTLEQAADVITTASNMHTKKPRRRTKPDTTTNPGTTRPAPPAAKPTDPTPRPAGDQHPTTHIDPAPPNPRNP
ncbi:MAG: D-glycero-alpha-D-manno-heptose-1,7-bisphosphate 7-phosphatase, partial [Phycisphaerae bacterium]